MVMDIITCCIVIATAVFYMRKGFALTVVSILQWFVCIVVGLLFCGRLKDLVVDKTPIDEALNSFFAKRFETSVTDTSAFQSVPKLFDSWMKDATVYISNTTAQGITSVVLSILCFLAIVIAIRIICWLFARLFSKKHHKGVIGFFDGLAGLALGVVMGFFFVLVVFALLVPVLSLLPASISAMINHSFDTSYFSGQIYDNNFLLELLKNLFN
jgi:ABC-type bacteriocin/lantibiotic exporter with double-glycine peptidase domain